MAERNTLSVTLSGQRINITKELAEQITADDCRYVIERIREMMRSPDDEVALKAIKLFLDKFAISSEKYVETAVASDKVFDKATFNHLLDGLLAKKV